MLVALNSIVYFKELLRLSCRVAPTQAFWIYAKQHRLQEPKNPLVLNLTPELEQVCTAYLQY
jgi:hypothetical protein